MRGVALWIVCCATVAQDFGGVERHLNSGEYTQALQLLQQFPDKTIRWRLLASRAYEGLKDPAQAVNEAESALQLDPGSEAAHLRLGQIFLSHNTPAAALEVFTEAQQLHPRSFLIHLGKGLALKELQKYDEAAIQLRSCLDQNPTSGLAFDGLATALLHSLQYDDLLKTARDFSTRNPGDYRGDYFSAAARDGLRLPDEETIRLLESSIRQNPNFAASHGLLGKILLRQKETAKAAAALERAVALRPDHLPSHLNLAKAYKNLGREAESAREYQIVSELNEKGRQPQPALLYRRGTQ